MEKKLFFPQTIFLSPNCSFDHVECSFEKAAEKTVPQTPNFFALIPKKKNDFQNSFNHEVPRDT